MSFDWTDERIAELKQRWAAGQSATQIANAICDRNGEPTRAAVIGKVHRLGIQKRLKAWEPGKATPRARVERQPKVPKVAKEEAAALASRALPKPTAHLWKQNPAGRVEPTRAGVCTIASPNAKPWLERAFGQCAYPVDGQGADVLSCCNPVDGSLPYCAGHFAFMHTGRELQPIKAPADRQMLELRKDAA